MMLPNLLNMKSFETQRKKLKMKAGWAQACCQVCKHTCRYSLLCLLGDLDIQMWSDIACTVSLKDTTGSEMRISAPPMKSSCTCHSAPHHHLLMMHARRCHRWIQSQQVLLSHALHSFRGHSILRAHEDTHRDV